jgi:hypothetical protein
LLSLGYGCGLRASEVERAGSAAEELIRYDPLIQGVARLVRKALTVGGRQIRPGRVLILLLGSANRDESRFTDPDRLDIGRGVDPKFEFRGRYALLHRGKVGADGDDRRIVAPSCSCFGAGTCGPPGPTVQDAIEMLRIPATCNPSNLMIGNTELELDSAALRPGGEYD